MRPRLLITAVALAATAACGASGDGPPEIEVDRTPCAHCGMLISEPLYAAAYQVPASTPRVFDDIKCLVEAAGREPRTGDLRFWFRDAAGTGWIGGTEAVFVASTNLRTPMGGGLIAFGDQAAAREAAAKHGGTVITSLERLLARGES